MLAKRKATKKPKKLSFANTQRIWYSKLAASGFEDIEYKNGMMRRTIPQSIDKNRKSQVLIASIQDYYTMATHFLNDYKFETEMDKIIWEYHTEGLSIRSIVSVLKKARVRRMGRDSVWKVVNRLENLMKLMYQIGTT